MNGPEAYVFNLTIIPTPDKNTYLEFYAGDISSVPADLLIVSAFPEDCSPVPGTVLGTLYERFGVQFETSDLSWPPSTTRVGFTDKVGRSPYKRIAVVFMRRDVTTAISIGHLQAAIDALSNSLPYIVEPNWDSLVLPLLGAGSQGIPVEQLVPLLFEGFHDWIMKAPSLEQFCHRKLTKTFVVRLIQPRSCESPCLRSWKD
jgi:hypothetical protein